MSINAITRDYGDSVTMVRIISTDTLAAVGTANYLVAQAANITLANNGPFSWLVSDFALVYASNGWGFFSISSDFKSLTPFVVGGGVAYSGGASVIGDVAIFSDTSGNIKNGFLLKAAHTAAYAGGSTSNAYTATGLTSTSIVTASNFSSTNAVSIVKVVPSANVLTVTWSADPGASTVVAYVSVDPAV